MVGWLDGWMDGWMDVSEDDDDDEQRTALHCTSVRTVPLSDGHTTVGGCCHARLRIMAVVNDRT